MHISYQRTSAILTMFMIVIAIVFSGCTDSVATKPSATPVPVTAITTITAKTTVLPSPGITPHTTTAAQVTGTERPHRIFGEYRWAEYRNNITQTLPPNPRYQWEMHERVEHSSGTYKGGPAVHDRITETGDYGEWVGDTLVTTKNGRVLVANLYFDAATGNLMGGDMTETIRGIVQPVADIAADHQFSRESRPSYEMGITPFGEMNITLTEKGTESVKVPAGMYPAARQYTGSFRDGTLITFWIAPDVPVPVRYQFPNRYLDGEDPFQSYELTGWG
jgi:hypothetical protein